MLDIVICKMTERINSLSKPFGIHFPSVVNSLLAAAVMERNSCPAIKETLALSSEPQFSPSDNIIDEKRTNLSKATGAYIDIENIVDD